jgi:folate-binding Fe-S cluster repair protein YgfZ
LLLSWKLSWCETIENAINIDDLRCSWPLKRTLMPINEPLINEADCQGQDWYDALRMYYGIPEGPVEIVRNKAIAHEYNFDIMNSSK